MLTLTVIRGERLTLGDMDSEAAQHETHNQGTDVDVYLPGRLMAEEDGDDNYRNLSAFHVRMLRARAFDLAKIMASCSAGKVRIYYNDPVVIAWFRAWYRKRGWRSYFPTPINTHNDSHRFHFHVSIPRWYGDRR